MKYNSKRNNIFSTATSGGSISNKSMLLLVLSLCLSLAAGGLNNPCQTDPEDPNVKSCTSEYKCCAYVNDSIYDAGAEIFFCMSQNDYDYYILDDGSYSENNGLTKYYYLECEQTIIK